MKVLLVKTSSMGDLIHTLPALTDAHHALPEIQFDWVAEETFREIPSWHPAVRQVLPVALRRWRKDLIASWRDGEIRRAVQQLRAAQYDLVIDAQGLLKSAVITRCAKGPSCGLNFKSSREPLAAVFYQTKFSVPRHTELHAISRLRRLFAAALQYNYQAENIDYGITREQFAKQEVAEKYVVFLHATSREEKLWPLVKWRKLAEIVGQQHYKIYLPWGNALEQQRAHAIADKFAHCEVLSRMRLHELAALLSQATAVVGVDTGLAHLTAALSVPAITLYPATDPGLIGACGPRNICLAEKNKQNQTAGEPLLQIEYVSELSVEEVWQRFKIYLSAAA